MIATPLARLRHPAGRFFRAARARVARWARPVPIAIASGAAAEVTRRRSELRLENALLRHQLVVLSRAVKRPRSAAVERALLVRPASRLRRRAEALVIVRPETILRWRRQGFRLCWRRTSRLRSAPGPKVAAGTIAPIREMAAANLPWAADRIRGELPKLEIEASKRTIRRYPRQARLRSRTGLAWPICLRNRAPDIWARDPLPVADLLFRPVFAFFAIALGSRRVAHVGVARHPADARVARQPREATPFDAWPQFPIRDNDAKYGAGFARLAAASGIRVPRTPIRARRANGTCERFLGSVRRECLDHILVLGERHLARVLREYVAYFNDERPHQGLGQRVPSERSAAISRVTMWGNVRVVPILGGLHHAYAKAA